MVKYAHNNVWGSVIMDNAFSDQEQKIKTYKTVCAKLGLVMCAYFICRILAGLTISYIFGESSVGSGSAMQYTLQTIVMLLFVYALPMVVTAMLFNSFNYYIRNPGTLEHLYKKPKRLAQKLGNFTAMYGMGLSVNLLTMLMFFLISLISSRPDGGIELERHFEQIAVGIPQDLLSAFIMVFVMVIVAPIVEEFWVRGIMYDALKPYGYGMAIIISSLLFGLMHSSLQMLFYTTALGLALGYVRYATDSLLVVTILHMLINAIAAGMIFLLSLTNITGGEHGLINTLSNIYIFAVLVLVVIGFIAFIKKIPKLKRYRITNNWDDVSTKKKLALFFVSIPVIIMLVIAFDTHANHLLLVKFLNTVR